MALGTIGETRKSKQRVGTEYYVYILTWPSTDPYHPNEVFYIGKGTRTRLFDHEREATSGVASRKCDVIRAIWASGGQVQKTILYQTRVERDALIYEWTLINMVYASIDLTNILKAGTIGVSNSKSRHTAKQELYTIGLQPKQIRENLGQSREGLARLTLTLNARTIRRAEAGQPITLDAAYQIFDAINRMHIMTGRAAITISDMELTLC